MHEVDAADLGRVDADLVGGHVEDAFDQLGGLGATGTAVGADGRVVREHRLGVEADLGHLVDTHRHHLRQHRQDGADGRVGARRCQHLAVEADDLAVVADAQAGGHHIVAAVDQRHHVLRTALGPLDGLAERERGLAGDEVLDVRRGFRPESTAHPRARDAQLLGLETEHRGVPGVDRVRRLVRHPHREPAVLGNADDPVVLHRDTGETLTDHRDLGHGVGTLARVAALLAELGGEAHIRAGVGEQERRVGREPGGRRHHDRQRVDVGEHLLGGVIGLRL